MFDSCRGRCVGVSCSHKDLEATDTLGRSSGFVIFHQILSVSSRSGLLPESLYITIEITRSVAGREPQEGLTFEILASFYTASASSQLCLVRRFLALDHAGFQSKGWLARKRFEINIRDSSEKVVGWEVVRFLQNER